MDAGRARALAETLHRGQIDAGGVTLIEHVPRVAVAVVPEARVVAWLHEALEYTSVSEEALLAQGLTTNELRAIRLMTHVNLARSDTNYLAHVEMLTRANGAGARLAISLAHVGELQERHQVATRSRRSTALMSRSRMNPTMPIVRMHRMMCS
jgi:hypothetical protein